VDEHILPFGPKRRLIDSTFFIHNISLFAAHMDAGDCKNSRHAQRCAEGPRDGRYVCVLSSALLHFALIEMIVNTVWETIGRNTKGILDRAFITDKKGV
jgi:hypothetical protein